MSNTTESIKSIVETFATESDKFWSGNNAAGTRARKALQELIKISRETRKQIQEEKTKRKTAK
jgi:hypothetical protein